MSEVNMGTNGEKENVDRPMDVEIEHSEIIDGTNSVIGQFMAQCNMADGDAKFSSELIEEAIELNDETLMRNEIEDIEKCVKIYDEAYIKIIDHCSRSGLNTQEHEVRRFKFLKMIKMAKVKASKSLADKLTTATANETDHHFKYAKIDIQQFDGDKADWIRFKTAFITYYANSSKLTKLEKHQILFTKTTGEAHHLISEYPLSGLHFDDAWQTLLDHYDDPLKTVARHLEALHNTPAVGTACGKSSRKQTLRDLITHFRPNVTALVTTFSEKPEIDPVSQFCIHEFLRKADKGTRLAWEKEMEKSKNFATFKEFLTFMEGRCNAYERAVNTTNSNNPGSSAKVFVTTNRKTSKNFASNPCYCCQKRDHYLHRCEKFLRLLPQERMELVKRKTLCWKCFRGRCDRKCKFTCRSCHKNHNTLLHVDDYKNPRQIQDAKYPKQRAENEDNEYGASKPVITNLEHFKLVTNGWVGSLVTDNLYALLATAVIEVTNLNGDKILARALLDSGSQLNFITENLARKLNLNTNTTSQIIEGIQRFRTKSSKEINITIKSVYSNFQMSITCLLLKEIVDLVPHEQFSIEHWDFPNHLSLADPQFNIPNGVDLLLGLGVFWKILKPNFREIGVGCPRLYATHLGWLVTGDIKLTECDMSESNYIFYTGQFDENLSLTVEKLWLLNDSENNPWTFEESECENHFLEHTFRKNGRFVVRLPFKIPRERLGDSKGQALKRFLALEYKFSKNKNFKETYVACFRDYIDQGHMREVLVDDKNSDKICNYLPHHGVLKESSTSTPLRPVFDASMKTSSGLSLNNCLMVGPVIQSDLMGILLRSRIHIFVFCADITQMYRQILLNEEDTSLQRVLWRKNKDEQIKIYELTTVTFGIASAPFLATRCLKKLGEDEGDNFPAAKGPLLNDFYVDNVFTGADSIENAIEIKKQLSEILNGAGFHLNKWCANDARILEGISKEKMEKNFPLNTGEEFAIKTLGIIWLPKEDVFRVWVNIKSIENYTKREILSVISSIFDPMGFLSPVTVTAKLIMQSLWSKSNSEILNWDSIVSDEIKKKLSEFVNELKSLNNLSIPRLIFQLGRPEIIELHGFSDASEKAYGAVLYIRSITKNGSKTELLTSKTKVAPLKKQTLAKLELCAALTLVKLIKKVKDALIGSININIIRLWSDSEITLHWIKSPAHRWQTFVANRVQQIQNLQENGVWDHVESEFNPADLLTKGIKPSKLQHCKIWWHGPEWLNNSNTPFDETSKFLVKNPIQIPEIRRSRAFVGISSIVKRSDMFEKYSSYTKLVRVNAWCLRFLWNSHWFGPYITGPINQFEIKWSTMVLIKLAQQECFPEELKTLRKNGTINANSSLASLTPFLDAEDVIHVGGRLQNSELSFEQRFPIVLPSKHPFTKLLIEYKHKTHLHAGPSLMRAVLRRKYWVLQQNKAIKYCIHRCIQCIRLKAETKTQVMASLPKVRVVPGRTFQNTGVDYAGPIKLLGKGGRHKVLIQGYIAIFVCLSTKAIHLELVSDLKTETFLAALNRFISRRGIPNNIYSDNGSTFIGAKTKLVELKNFFENKGDEIIKQILNKGCQWHFIPPHSPHFGGMWEAGVKSVKSHLKPVIGSGLFTYEQYETILCQIEACLNSRPLYADSSDPNEIGALTPGHFLIGGPITSLPNPDLTSVPLNKLKYWELVKRQVQEFWKKWSRDYLNTLQQRNKWKITKNEFKVGDVVIIKEDNTPPTHWPLARITALHPGKDGLVRVVTLVLRLGPYENLLDSKKKVTLTETKRSVTKLICLPTINE